MNLSAWIVAMVGPIAARVLSSLGLSMVVLTGAVAAFDTLLDQVIANIGGMPAATLQLGGLMGLWEGIGIYLGALTFALTWASSKGFWALAKA